MSDDMEDIIQLIDMYLHEHFYIISRPDFEDILVTELKQLCDISEEEEDEDVPKQTDDIYRGLYYYYLHIMPRREFSTSFIYKTPCIQETSSKISYILSKPQPIQKTPEWYEYRKQVITASNLYKVFGSQCVQNELIYEKCKPSTPIVEDIDVPCINTNSSLHWGNKYEPLSILIYESIYSTTISSLGCITHDIHSFIGASPDGINTNPLSPRYGRLIEIKNVKSRDIDGSISEPYWIQMQIQMEVCDMNECDFVETKFMEYENYSDYVSDNGISLDDLEEDGYEYEYIKHAGKIIKGMMMYFHKPSEAPKYVYKPFTISLEEEDKWENDITEEYVLNGYQWITNVYWKLVVFNCQLVLRNTFWFLNAFPHVSNIWNTILQERESGYDHRKPNTRTKKMDQWMY